MNVQYSQPLRKKCRQYMSLVRTPVHTLDANPQVLAGLNQNV